MSCLVCAAAVNYRCLNRAAAANYRCLDRAAAANYRRRVRFVLLLLVIVVSWWWRQLAKGKTQMTVKRALNGKLWDIQVEVSKKT